MFLHPRPVERVELITENGLRKQREAIFCQDKVMCDLTNRVCRVQSRRRWRGQRFVCLFDLAHIVSNCIYHGLSSDLVEGFDCSASDGGDRLSGLVDIVDSQ